MMLPGIEGLTNVSEKKEISEPNARTYVYTKENVEASTSRVLAC